MTKAHFGDLVRVDMKDGIAAYEAVVIGTMEYSDDVLLVATEKYVGAPYNRQWLSTIGPVEIEVARKLRDRYLAQFPGTLKDHATSTPETTR